MDALLAERHIPLARMLARQAVRRYRLPRQRGLTFDEVYSDALFGLTKAASRHRPGKDFAPYASSFIVGEIRHGIRARVEVRGGSSHRPPACLSLDAPQHADDPEPFGSSVPDKTPGPVERAALAEIWRTVDELPDSERLAVRGYYQLELSQAEIAAARGTNQMAVSRALDRARKRLSHRLAA